MLLSSLQLLSEKNVTCKLQKNNCQKRVESSTKNTKHQPKLGLGALEFQVPATDFGK